MHALHGDVCHVVSVDVRSRLDYAVKSTGACVQEPPALQSIDSEFRSCVKVEVDVLGSRP